MSLKSLVIAVASIVCLLVTAGAQQQQQRRPPITGLALEITYLEGRPPAYQQVPWSNIPKGGAWYGLFGRVAGWQLPAGAEPVNAVRIVPYLDGDTVRITVSVLRGVKFQDIEDAVGTYAVRENEKLTIAALKNFGVEPFAIKVVRVAPETSDVPSIVNNTKSVEVVGIEPLVSTFPHYKLTLHNLSDKNISALKVNVLREGKVVLSSMPQRKDGEPLIEAGDSSNLTQALSTRAESTPGGYAPASPTAQQIVITALIFEDGAYEGDAQAAATYRGFVAGRKTELKRLVPLLESALATPASPENLRTQLGALSFDVDDADVVLLTKAFPGVDRQQLQGPIEIAIHSVRREVLDQLETFQPDQHSAGDFQIWLTGIKDRYSAWLSRVSPNNISQH